MACMDFSFDSRIRKKYVPLINQQRYLRHVKRIAARNLFIPLPILRSKLLSSKQKIDQNILDQLNNDNDNELDEPQLYSSLNISFYFTIHHPLIGDLLYRSEYIANNNPSWKVFDGSSLCSPSISQFIVRVYFVMMNSEQSNGKKSVSDNNNDNDVESGTLFLEWKVNLTGLLYIGEEFPHDRRLTRNSIIFGFAEGFYTSVCSVASELLLNHSMPPSESLQIVDHSSTRYSYCLNTLIRIQMVQCIMQATAAQSKIEKLSLEEELKKFRHKQELQSEIEKMKTSIEFLTIVADRRRQRLRELRNEMITIEEKLNESNMDMSSNVQLLKQELSLLSELRTIRIPESARKLSQIRSALVHHRRMLARKFFSDIYPIVPFPDNQGYSINCVHLPSAQDMEQHQMKMISVGLGYVAHLIYYLAFVLDIYLFHQIIPMGSHSSLLDLFNRLLQPNDRIVPLYLKSKSSLNVKLFKHGWHLLNRNIVFIRQSMGLISTDLAMTLWNLHSLYLERLAYDNDEHHIEHDNTLNRFNTYSPSIIVNIDHHHLGPLGHSDNAETNNVKILNDINEIKINNIMIDTLWKEVEQMTIQSMKYKPQSGKSGKKHSKNSQQLEQQQQSSVMMSIVEDEIKDIILKQRQAKRQQNSERLSQLSSSLSFSRAISSFNLLTPESIRSSVISTSSPQDILRHQRRCSVTTMNLSYQLSSSSYGSSGGGGGNGGSTGSHHSTLSSSSLRLNNQYPPQPSSSSSSLFQQFHSIRRSQNQYNMNHNQMMIHGPRSLPSMMMSNNNNSFLHRSPRINNSQLLEKILNRSSNSRSSSSSTSSSSSSMQSPFNNNHLSISLDNGLNLMEKHNSRHNNNNNNNDHHHKQQLRQPQELVDNHNNDDDDVDDGNITFLVEDNID